MDERPVLFFDSGVGGLPYLERGRNKLVRERFIYLADNINFPYGEKPADEVRRIVVDVIGKAIEAIGPKCIVVACNTASVIALAALRTHFTSLPFIGVVPAVKPAANASRVKKIAVLATQRTVKDSYLTDLIRSFAQGCEVTGIPAGGIADFVETRYLHATEAERLEAVRGASREILAARVDAVVLACTHFVHLEREFRQTLGDSVQVIDSREGVANQLVKILTENHLLSDSVIPPTGKNLFYITGDSTQEMYRQFAERFGLAYRGVLDAFRGT